MDTIILDASVLVKFFSDDEKDKISLKLLEQYSKQKCSFAILEISLYEMVNALKLSKKSSSKMTYEAVAAILEMKQKTIPFSLELIKKSLEIMDMFKIAIYDALYVAAAEIEHIPLLTADYKHQPKKMSKQIVFYDEWKE
jgi:predicted nucleic acid-binding protein